MRCCALCGKEVKSIFHYRTLGNEFCSDCYGYVSYFCKTPEDIKRRTIDELKALYEKKECDICGNKVSALDKIYVHDGMICRNCEKLLRPYFKIYSAEHAATIAVNVVNAAINIAFDNTVMDMCEADDPLKKSDIASLKEIYELIKSSEQGK